MLLRHRVPGIESRPAQRTKGLEHLKDEWIAVLRWLQANRVEHVLVGAAAEAIRGHSRAEGPVAIVPAPYGRNLDRLARALTAAHARMRVDGEAGTTPVKMSGEKLARGSWWTLRCGTHDIDIEGGPPRGGRDVRGVRRYQELLYEAGRFELEPGLGVEVAAPEDLEHYSHVRRFGFAPEIVITRTTEPEPPETFESEARESEAPEAESRGFEPDV
jgi:hypothetical protein